MNSNLKRMFDSANDTTINLVGAVAAVIAAITSLWTAVTSTFRHRRPKPVVIGNVKQISQQTGWYTLSIQIANSAKVPFNVTEIRVKRPPTLKLCIMSHGKAVSDFLAQGKADELVLANAAQRRYVVNPGQHLTFQELAHYLPSSSRKTFSIQLTLSWSDDVSRIVRVQTTIMAPAATRIAPVEIS